MKDENNILKNIGNKNPFTVPENYFENLASNIEKQINIEAKTEKEFSAEAEKTQTISLFQKIKPLFYAAALAVAAFFIGDYLSTSSKTDLTEPATAETITPETSDVLLTYIDESVLIDYLIENE